MKMTIKKHTRFGKLRIIKEVGNQRPRIFDCVCDCGSAARVKLSNIRNGATKSCGCVRKKLARTKSTTHNLSKTASYSVWRAMKCRCYVKTDPSYKRYGGRGIKVCKRWINSFENFYEDVGKKPKECSLDRINVNGNYSKENCRWATRTTQQNNMRSNKFFEYKNEKLTAPQIVRQYGSIVSSGLLYSRLKNGWDTDLARTTQKGEGK